MCCRMLEFVNDRASVSADRSTNPELILLITGQRCCRSRNQFEKWVVDIKERVSLIQAQPIRAATF